jgi:hypothetical protein
VVPVEVLAVNDHGARATPKNVSRVRHDRFPHPDPLPEGEGDVEIECLHKGTNYRAPERLLRPPGRDRQPALAGCVWPVPVCMLSNKGWKRPQRMPSNDTDRPIRLLDLSDIRFRAGKTWDSEPVLRALTRFIAKEIAEDGLIPDLVVITGDLAFSGKAEEYQLARRWLGEKLWLMLNGEGSHRLPPDRLLLVPGNHDVDRDAVDVVAQATQKALLSQRDQDQIAQVLGDAAQRQVLLKRHGAYLAFYGGWLGETQTLPWWQRVIEIRGIRLHLAGLDSAWMARGEMDRSNLLFGRFQINDTVVTDEAERADWRIALLHHPWGSTWPNSIRPRPARTSTCTGTCCCVVTCTRAMRPS